MTSIQPQVDPWQEAYQRCEHPQVELRYKETISNTRQYREQCLTCGALIRHIKKASIAPVQMATIPPFDDELQSNWWRSQSDEYTRRREAQEQAEQDRWWRWYNTYLRSPGWLEKRELVLQRANGVCQGCEVAPAIQVHHLNYRHVGDELLFDLVAVCKDCHQKAHPDKTINTDD